MNMSTAAIHVERSGDTAQVTIDNAAKANALDSALLDALCEVFVALAFDPPRAIVLRGAGEKAFAGGADLRELGALDEKTARTFITRVHAAFGYSLWAISNQAGRLTRWWRRSGTRRTWWRWLALAAVVALFIPVRQSVLAPAEVIALEAQAIAAPMDGVVKSFSVQPNRPVRRGEVIFTLDDTTLRNRREVAIKALEVARADALLAAQKAFDSLQAKGEFGTLQGRVREREAEVAYLNELLSRVEVRAPAGGVAIYGDPNDWIGRPVVTGERIVLLADPKDAGVLVWLPVADAINLNPGAEMRVFLHVAPLSPYAAKLTQTSYQAALSPEGVASYRIRGSFDGLAAEARVGLKGTAKLYGERVLLAYVLFRRPLAALREWTGL